MSEEKADRRGPHTSQGTGTAPVLSIGRGRLLLLASRYFVGTRYILLSGYGDDTKTLLDLWVRDSGTVDDFTKPACRLEHRKWPT